MLESVSINWWAILIAGVINMILGAIWYAPAVFGKSWKEASGIKDMNPNPTTMGLMFVVAVLIAVISRYFIGWIGADTYVTGLEVGALAGIGFVALTGASGTLASKTSWNLLAINAGYWVVALALMGAVLAGMQ